MTGTLAGVPLYESAGWVAVEDVEETSGGAAVPLVRMRKAVLPR